MTIDESLSIKHFALKSQTTYFDMKISGLKKWTNNVND